MKLKWLALLYMAYVLLQSFINLRGTPETIEQGTVSLFRALQAYVTEPRSARNGG
jgi:hypothetical protein